MSIAILIVIFGILRTPLKLMLLKKSSTEILIMKVYAYFNLPEDKPYLINIHDFKKYFDQDDFVNRDCFNVKDAYLSSWFSVDEENRQVFILPTVQFVNGRTQFINGRHRTAVLINYMELIPIALAMPLNWEPKVLNKINQRPIVKDKTIEIPNLKIYDSLD